MGFSRQECWSGEPLPSLAAIWGWFLSLRGYSPFSAMWFPLQNEFAPSRPSRLFLRRAQPLLSTHLIRSAPPRWSPYWLTQSQLMSNLTNHRSDIPAYSQVLWGEGGCASVFQEMKIWGPSGMVLCRKNSFWEKERSGLGRKEALGIFVSR